MVVDAWVTTAWTPGSHTNGSASGPGSSTTTIASAGQGPARAPRTSAVVRRARLAGRARSALPATSAEAATTVGTQTGELAACQPSTTP